MTKRTNITDAIVEFITEAPDTDVPDSARDIFRLSLVDWVAVALAARDEPVSQITRGTAEEDGGNEQAYAIGLNQRQPARAAALVNGTTSHALDYDDTHFASLGHPSVAVIPAALAIADKLGASPKAFADAALRGMELAVRIGIWLGRDHYHTGFHVTPTAGTFGAAMASARLLGLSADQTRSALGLAASTAGGVKAQFGTMGKPFHAGIAAANGVEVALLASRGLSAAQQGLEGAQGYGETHHCRFDDFAFDGLGETYLFENVSHKFHACCHGTHAALEALISLRNEHWIRPAEIEEIEITVHPQYLDICNITNPDTGLEAKFSYQMVAALVMHEHDTARMDTFNDAVCQDAKILALRDRVRVKTTLLMAESAAGVRVVLKGGTVVTRGHDLIAQQEYEIREERVRAKVASLLGDATADTLWQEVAQMTELPSNWMQCHLAETSD